MDNKQIITIATSKKLYIDMAVNLIRSFILWNKNNHISFYLATDIPQYLPADVKEYINLIHLQPNELGEGFSPKLHLDKIAPAGKTLFIDSDCLIYGSLVPVFEQFNGRKVSVIGNYISKGEWFGDIAAVCQKFNIPHLPKFNGGIYYLEQGPEAAKVYATARELENSYDEIGFVRLRKRPNDELLMALAMQLHGQKPVMDDGTVMSDPQACRGSYKLNVISGKRQLVNPPSPNPLHQGWYPFKTVSPVIVHFLGYYTQHYPYKKDVYRLKMLATGNLDLFTEVKALVTIQYPEQITKLFKHLLRPVYHVVFGNRKVKPSERLV